MEKFIWDNKYSVGHPLIDHQHRSLMGIVNELVELSEEKAPSSSKYINILMQLDEYVHTHFKAEEILMTQVGYPDLVQHLSIHGALSDQASRLIMNINIDDLNSTVQFLVEWLEQHIMVEDMKFKHYVS